ncbi:hypothetical protein HOLleu_44324 [Holothuria leucospilota]|uniref:Uncharacterized protein n=1 Tax=Holothuria leucospilota TaxID=206669 RepID=A0A9Q0YCK2_HOLLE|nr:hypothetical protein HOLleu_44324 [Holothuria leucospilota]
MSDWSLNVLYGVSRGQKATFLKIPKIIIWRHQRSQSKISQEFPRSSYGVTRGQKAKYPKCSQDHHLGSPEVKKLIS